MKYRFLTADVFTDRTFGGNPLAVLPDARGLDGERMQRIAREFHLSETSFVLPAERGGTRRVRIFTPGRELPFAGHPTVGTALALAWLGEVRPDGAQARIVLEEGVGPVPCSIRYAEGRAVFAQLTAAQPPAPGPAPPSRPDLAAALSLAEADLADDPVETWSAGVPFVFVALRGRDALARCRVDGARWAALRARGGGEVLVLVREGAEEVRARMFAPDLGVEEDPATGAAAAALPGYLVAREGARAADGPRRWTVTQGVEMGRPSRIEVEADVEAGRPVTVRVGGSAVPVMEGQIDVP